MKKLVWSLTLLLFSCTKETMIPVFPLSSKVDTLKVAKKDLSVPKIDVSKPLPPVIVVSPKKVKSLPKKKFKKFIIPQNLGKDAALGTDANDFDSAMGSTPPQPTEEKPVVHYYYNCRAESLVAWGQALHFEEWVSQFLALKKCYSLTPKGLPCKLILPCKKEQIYDKTIEDLQPK